MYSRPARLPGPAKTIVNHNEYYTPSGAISECGKDLKTWQAQGEDVGSTVAALPKDETIIGWARSLLDF